jgi:adenylate cyclase
MPRLILIAVSALVVVGFGSSSTAARHGRSGYTRPPPGSLLRTYLGEEPGRRVHAGAIERGSVESIKAALWYADIRGFTATSDSFPGPVIIDLLNNVFEVLTAALRSHGGEVLKFVGDGMLAILSFEDADRVETCRRALDAAAERSSR